VIGPLLSWIDAVPWDLMAVAVVLIVAAVLVVLIAREVSRYTQE
jgi:hypothetical protein